MLIAQITDLHVKQEGRLAYGAIDTAACLVACVDQLCSIWPQPDVVVVTGDLVDGGIAAQYDRVRSLLAPIPCPVFVLPGNHDDRDALRRCFGGDGYLPRSGFLQYVVEDFPVRLIALDTVIPQQGGGNLCDERLAWLDRTLAVAPHRPAVVMMHHPPFDTGIAYMDRMGLAGADRFAAVIARHPQVERILCGHLHRSIVSRVGGTVAATIPSTAHQLALELQPDPIGAYVMEPPAIGLNLWRGEAPLISHLSLVGEFGGIRPFAKASERP